MDDKTNQSAENETPASKTNDDTVDGAVGEESHLRECLISPTADRTRSSLSSRLSPIVNESDDRLTVRLPATYSSINDPRLSASESSSLRASMTRYRYYGRLAAYQDNPLIMPSHVLPSNFFRVIPVLRSPGEKQSSVITIFSIWNTMMGTSVLSLPWALGKAGLACGIVLMIFVAAVTLYTAYRVMKSPQYLYVNTPVVEFSDVCRYYLGRWGEYVSILFSLVALLGAAIAYWVLMANFLYNSVHFIFAKVTQEPSDRPPVSLNNFSFHDGTVAVVYIMAFIVYKAFKWGINLEPKSTNLVTDVPEFVTSFPILTGILSLAYMIHNCLLSILSYQQHPENNGRDISIAFGCVTFTYLFISVIFYISFPLPKQCIEDILLSNFLSSDVMAFVARLFLFIQIMTVFPLLTYIFRMQLLNLMFKSVYPSFKHVFILNILILIPCVLFAVFLPHIGHIIRFTGSLCGLVYIFTLPCLIYILCMRQQQQLTPVVLVFHATIIVLGAANFIAQFLYL